MGNDLLISAPSTSRRAAGFIPAGSDGGRKARRSPGFEKLAWLLLRIALLPDAVPECFSDAKRLSVQRLERRPSPGNQTLTAQKGVE
jgi:hypothetical protein